MATKQTYKSGFTIVELLIVIVVIGILAAITIVAYNGVADRANDTSVRNDLSNFSKQMTLRAVEGGEIPRGETYGSGEFGDAEVALREMSFRVSQSSYGNHFVDVSDGGKKYNLLYCYTKSGDDWAFVAGSPIDKVYSVTSKNLTIHEYPQTMWESSGWGEICPDVLGVADAASGDGTWLYQNSTWNDWVLNR